MHLISASSRNCTRLPFFDDDFPSLARGAGSGDLVGRGDGAAVGTARESVGRLLLADDFVDVGTARESFGRAARAVGASILDVWLWWLIMI